jgi:uncharacterized protein
MGVAVIRFYGSLNDFLPRNLKHHNISSRVNDTAQLKDFIESFGAPHPEIELVLVNGHPADFHSMVRAGDRISVYPHFQQIEIPAQIQVSPPQLTDKKFVLDTHLGRLACYLRLIGVDTLYDIRSDDSDLADISSTEDRILLTRDRSLLKRKVIRYGYCIRSTNPEDQWHEAILQFDLENQFKPFTRCLRCNGELHHIGKSEVLEMLPERTAKYYDDFQRCRDCLKIFWKGSHFIRLQNRMNDVMKKLGIKNCWNQEFE